jgi:hypothetical protein
VIEKTDCRFAAETECEMGRGLRGMGFEWSNSSDGAEEEVGNGVAEAVSGWSLMNIGERPPMLDTERELP